MNQARFVTGTGTEVGKTMVSCLLALRLKTNYFKPIQSGTPTDTEFMRSVLGSSRVFEEVYRLKNPLSPNQAAELDGLSIELSRISIEHKRPLGHLLVEGAGGVLSPVNQHETMLDLIAYLQLKTIVVAKSGLGTISHTLQTIGTLRSRQIPLSCIIFFGRPHERNMKDIAERTGIKTIDYLEIKNLSWENI